MSDRIILQVMEFTRRLITDALEQGFTKFAVKTSEIAQQIQKLGAVEIFALNAEGTGDYVLGKDIVIHQITSKLDELKTLEITKPFILIQTQDWRIIPLENLISKFQTRTSQLIANANSIDEAELLLTTLEQGVDLVLIQLNNELDLKKLAELDRDQQILELIPLEIQRIEQVGLGDRVCIDTTSVLNPLEGMLIGSQSNGYFLVHNENVESPYADPRPFRVNAGAIHSYIRVPEGKTKYLSEIIGGSRVQIISSKGKVRSVAVGRAKVEKRPLLLIIAKPFVGNAKEPTTSLALAQQDTQYQVILQNAETIRLIGLDNELKSVVHLQKGDLVLGYIEQGGRHFGEKIEETITER